MEQQVIEQLSGYRQIVARIHLLENYSIGNGITVSRLNQDDQLQDLHRRLRGLPSYMYLSEREQRLETTAHAYMNNYPPGTRAQLAAVPNRCMDPEDEKLLKELRGKIEKVIEARTGSRDNFDAVIERISELQDLQQQRDRIDQALEALEGYKPNYAKLLRLRYCDGRAWESVARELHLSESGCFKWRVRAIKEYCSLARYTIG